MSICKFYKIFEVSIPLPPRQIQSERTVRRGGESDSTLRLHGTFINFQLKT